MGRTCHVTTCIPYALAKVTNWLCNSMVLLMLVWPLSCVKPSAQNSTYFLSFIARLYCLIDWFSLMCHTWISSQCIGHSFIHARWILKWNRHEGKKQRLLWLSSRFHGNGCYWEGSEKLRIHWGCYCIF